MVCSSIRHLHHQQQLHDCRLHQHAQHMAPTRLRRELCFREELLLHSTKHHHGPDGSVTTTKRMHNTYGYYLLLALALDGRVINMTATITTTALETVNINQLWWVLLPYHTSHHCSPPSRTHESSQSIDLSWEETGSGESRDP